MSESPSNFAPATKSRAGCRTIIGTALCLVGIVSSKPIAAFFLGVGLLLTLPSSADNRRTFSWSRRIATLFYILGVVLLVNRSWFFLIFGGAGYLLGGWEPVLRWRDAIQNKLTTLHAEWWVNLLANFLIVVGFIAILIPRLLPNGRVTVNAMGLENLLPLPFLGLLFIIMGFGIRRRALWGGVFGLGLSFAFLLDSLNKAFIFTQGDISLLPKGILANLGKILLAWAIAWGFYRLFFPDVTARADVWRAKLEANLQDAELALQSIGQRLYVVEGEAATARRDAEAERIKFHSVFEALGQGIVLTDPSLRIQYMNPALAGLFGLKRDEWQGRIWPGFTGLPRVLPESDPAVDDKPTPHHLPENGEQDEIEVVCEQSESRRRVVCAFQKISGDQGENLGSIGFVRDVTLEREIDRMKTEFVSSVSHELRTPLTSISAYTEMLRDEEIEDESTRTEYLHIILEESERLSKLLNQILDLSRIEAGRKECRFASHSLMALLKRAVTISQPSAEKKDQSLVLELPGEDLKATVDADLILQALLNLVSNAIKYTQTGGRIRARLSREAEWYSFWIEDNGPGISIENQKKLFSRFFRVDGESARKVTGTGLGLALVKHIAVLHHGEVLLESEIGRGSRFSLRLPFELPSVSSDSDKAGVDDRTRVGAK